MIIAWETAGRLQTLEFDATIRELHLGTATVTEHPVERGVDMTDHVHADRARLTAELFVTNTPIRNIGGPNSAARVVGAQLPLVIIGRSNVLASYARVSGGPGFTVPLPGRPQIGATEVEVTPATRKELRNDVTLNVLQFPTQFDRVRAVHGLLDGLRRAGTKLRILQALKDYDQMILTSLSAPRTSEDAVSFTVELVEVRFGTAELIDVPVPLEARAQKEKPQGSKASYELSEQKQSRLSAGSEYVQNNILGRDFRPLP